jgi:carboxyl-terminal processing protease
MENAKNLAGIVARSKAPREGALAAVRSFRLVILIAATAAVLSCTSSPTAVSSKDRLDQIPPGTELTRAQLRDWSVIWRFVDKNHVDPGLRGVDWEAARVSVAMKIKAGLDNASFTALVNEALAPLIDYDSHTQYSPPENVSVGDALPEQSFAGVGIRIARGAGDHAVIITVFPGGPAARAGIASHDRILAIDGHTALDARGEPDVLSIRGPAGSSVRLRIASPGGEPREITLVRETVSPDAGLVVARLLPRELMGGRRIGYALLASFAGPGADHLRAEFARLSADAPLDGFILDLRPNGGGYLEVMASCIGLFYGGKTGSIRLIAGAVLALPPSGDAVGNSRVVPLAVLVHGTTHSAAEMMAGTLQNAGRTCLIGDRTAGDTGYPKEMALPGGGYISVTQGMYILPDGSDPGWIGRGIVPDFVVPGSGWDEVTVEEDPAIAKAIEVLTIHP